MGTNTSEGYDLLVANFSRPYPSLIFGADPANQSYTRTRTGFRFRHIQNIGFAFDHTNATYSPARSVITKITNAEFDPFATGTLRPSAELTVASNTFSGGSASLFVGPFELISGRDFVVGGTAIVTATNIAAALDNLPGYNGVPSGTIVDVFGPLGQMGLRFDAAYGGGTLNFTIIYYDKVGFLGNPVGTPDRPLEPPVILPAGLPNGVAP